MHLAVGITGASGYCLGHEITQALASRGHDVTLIVSDAAPQIAQLEGCDVAATRALATAALGVSHPKLDDCIAEARDAGALGAKLSGSGWGGIMFALVEADTRDAVRAALERTRARIIATTIGGPGTRKEE